MFTYINYKDSCCSSSYTCLIGSIVTNYIYLMQCGDVHSLLVRDGVPIGYAIRQKVFFSSFFLKTYRNDKVTTDKFCARRKLLPNEGTLKLMRHLAQKYYNGICIDMKKSNINLVTTPIITRNFMVFSSAFNNLFFLRMQQHFVMLFTHSRLHWSTHMCNYITAKSSNVEHAYAYEQKNPLKSFLSHVKLTTAYNQGNYTSMAINVLVRRCVSCYKQLNECDATLDKVNKLLYLEQLLQTCSYYRISTQQKKHG